MNISIANRLRPYSHIPGAQCAIPGTHFILEAFPTLLRLGNIEIPLKFTGPVRDFTLQQDLEKNCALVFGKAKEGSFKIEIGAQSGGFEISFYEEKKFFPAKLFFFLPEQWERLSLGMHKAQDWDLVLRRFDLKEILPVLYGLGQKIPPLPSQPLTGTARLLAFSEDRVLEGFEALCRAAFHKILVPRLHDDQHQGLCSDEGPDEEAAGNPFFLLQEAARRIRSLFIREEDDRVRLLPNCPFDAGRMANVQVKVGSLDLEWAKRLLRRAVLRPAASGEIALDLQKEIRSFRVKTGGREKGRKQSASEPLLLEAGKTYFLDRFST